LELGANQATEALPADGNDTARDRGAPGTVRGVTAALNAEAGEGPTTLVAFTENRYATPLSKLSTLHVNADVVEHVRATDPTFGVAVTV
jgi:hypothetical protein